MTATGMKARMEALAECEANDSDISFTLKKNDFRILGYVVEVREQSFLLLRAIGPMSDWNPIEPLEILFDEVDFSFVECYHEKTRRFVKYFWNDQSRTWCPDQGLCPACLRPFTKSLNRCQYCGWTPA